MKIICSFHQLREEFGIKRKKIEEEREKREEKKEHQRTAVPSRGVDDRPGSGVLEVSGGGGF